jgi:hypothetical protein
VENTNARAGRPWFPTNDCHAAAHHGAVHGWHRVRHLRQPCDYFLRILSCFKTISPAWPMQTASWRGMAQSDAPPQGRAASRHGAAQRMTIALCEFDAIFFTKPTKQLVSI